MTTYELGEIVLVDFPLSGSPSRKRRPALVILDVGDADIVLAPITTRKRSGPGDCALREWSADGLLRASWVRLAKVACLDKGDIARRLGRLVADDQAAVAAVWGQLYALGSQEAQ